MVKTYTVKDFFARVEKEFDYHGHQQHPEILDEVQKMSDTGVPVPVASYLVCEGYACPLNPHKLVRTFEIKIEDLHNARKKTNRQRPNFNHPVAKALIRKGIFPAQYETDILRGLDALSKGGTRLESISAAYLLLQQTYTPVTQAALSEIFRCSDPGVRSMIKPIEARLGPENRHALHEVGALLKEHQKKTFLEEYRKDSSYAEKRVVYERFMPVMHDDLPKEIVQDLLCQELVNDIDAFPPFFGAITKESSKDYFKDLPVQKMKELLCAAPIDAKTISKRLEYLPLPIEDFHDCMLSLPKEQVNPLLHKQLETISRSQGEDGKHFLVPAEKILDYLDQDDIRRLVKRRFEKGETLHWLLEAIQLPAAQIRNCLKEIPDQAILRQLRYITWGTYFPSNQKRVNEFFDDLDISAGKRAEYLKQLHDA